MLLLFFDIKKDKKTTKQYSKIQFGLRRMP